MHDVAAIVLAAGAGTRFGGHKQFERAGAARLVDHSVRSVSAIADCVIVVVPPGIDWDGEGTGVVGGATRAESVRNGLARVPDEAELVIVHDAAHPLAPASLAERLVRAVRAGADGAVPVLSTRETVAHAHGDVLGPAVPREQLVFVQMPHAFRTSVLRAAHATSIAADDDASLLQELGYRLVTVEGDVANLHVTTADELKLLRRLVDKGRRLP